MRRIEEFFPGEWLSKLDSKVRALSVQGVTADSRQVKPGMIFVATRGESQDGHRFIAQAHQSGASLIVGEDPVPAGIPYLQVANGRLALARLAAAFYDNPSHAMLMVGVTGTSGKTTTSYLVESILKAAGHHVGLIGTVAFRYKDKVIDSTHTTPGAAELQRLLAEMRDAGCTAVVMEVSSHSLKQHRAAYLAFDAMIFTNLTPEHLDYHPDMEDYFGAKAMLFTEYAAESRRAGKAPVASIGVDTEWGQRLARELQARKPAEMARVVTYSSDVTPAELQGSLLKMGLEGIHGEIAGVKIDSALTAKFNVANILGAVGAALGLKLNPQAIAQGVNELESVPGRLQAVPNAQGIHVLVDYAHKPDALEKVLQTLRGIIQDSRQSSGGSPRLITVFGCGGDRDRTKRPVMGKLAVELSDLTIVTSDNPRTENPQSIIDEIVSGMSGHSNFTVEPDRKKAIYSAIDDAKRGDIVLIAGKGHEDYQIIGTTKIHFDDREVASEALRLK
ncbi:MAG: UDP-N-acetylmuramoyl-L-alanyl-D-glutamate--2,6-diaminopimelate ligase [Bdellovibrionia bacterium]